MSCFCYHCISSSDIGIIETLGKFERIAEPGLNTINCCTQSIVGKLSLKIKSIPIGVESKTKDDTMVMVKVNVQYRVIATKVQEAFYRFSDPRGQIQNFAQSVIRGEVPKHSLDELFVIRDEMQKVLQDELNHKMVNFGYEIVATLIVDIDPSRNIKQAMNQVNTNARLRVAMEYKAEAEKLETVTNASAHSEATRLSGVGLAGQRQAVINGLQESVTQFRNHVRDVSSKEVMAMLLMNQYFDALKDIVQIGRGNVVFLPGDNASAMDVTEGVLAAGAGDKKGR